MKKIRKGDSISPAHLTDGYESGSGFREAFSRIMGKESLKDCKAILKASWLDTKLGPMLAIGDDNYLYLLEFIGSRGLEQEIERLRNKAKSRIIPGLTAPIELIKKELTLYFDGKLKEFKTPIIMLGTPFQEQVWNALIKIPYGSTCSYGDLARNIGKPTAFRAVANANGTNQLAIIIPCHRVINTNGELGGYGGGIACKKALLQIEQGDAQ